MNKAPAPTPKLMVFMSVAPALELSFHSMSPDPFFNCLGVPQVELKIDYIKYTKLREYTKVFNNLIW